MEDHAEEALHMKIIIKTNTNHVVHHRGVELEADVGRTDMEDHAEEALHMKIIIRTNTNHDVHHGPVELETDVGGTDMEDHIAKAMHMKIIMKTNTIMMYIMVVSNWRLMLEDRYGRSHCGGPAHEDHNEDQHHVQHRRVELKANVGGTDMEDHAKEALQVKI
jgi:hypothetical protein